MINDALGSNDRPIHGRSSRVSMLMVPEREMIIAPTSSYRSTFLFSHLSSRVLNFFSEKIMNADFRLI